MVGTNAELSLIAHDTVGCKVDTQFTLFILSVLNDTRLCEPVTDDLVGLFILDLLGVSNQLLAQLCNKYFDSHW